MFYIEKDNKILLFDEDLEKLQNTLLFMPECIDLEIQETNRPIVDFQFADTEEYEQEQAQKERERLNMLTLTAADVERAIYKAKGMDFEDILELVKDNQDIDVKALKIEFKANNFYRGNPYIEQVGLLLGFTSQMLDEFFEANDYTKLIPIPAEDEPSEADNLEQLSEE